MVEMAAIGTALAFVPEHIWDPLLPTARDHVIEWLRGIERYEPAANNWQFMRLLVAMGLERVGVRVDTKALKRSQNMVECFYVGHGWYEDGSPHNTDYYIAFAFHTYGLMLAASGLGDRSLADAYRERARLFAPQFVHWFAPDGAAIPFGRSQTYRMAQGSFWGALALADEEALPWGTVRGMALRHLRWWAQRPISHRDGVLSLGYGYANYRVIENYSSAGSPYWAMKAFLMLAAPNDHPFWTAAEEPLAPLDSPVTLTGCGMVVDRDERQTIALVAQGAPPKSWVEQDDAKYRKFAYSSVFGFSGDFVSIFGSSASDSALALTDIESGVRRLLHQLQPSLGRGRRGLRTVGAVGRCSRRHRAGRRGARPRAYPPHHDRSGAARRRRGLCPRLRAGRARPARPQRGRRSPPGQGHHAVGCVGHH